eukprot:scaffold7944_cov131-Isochrysis_galbana.AAC.4
MAVTDAASHSASPFSPGMDVNETEGGHAGLLTSEKEHASAATLAVPMALAPWHEKQSCMALLGAASRPLRLCIAAVRRCGD